MNMLQEIINKAATMFVQPSLEDEYRRGYEAGVLAERLVKAKEKEDREYDILCRGIMLGKEEVLKELEDDIEEISAREFEELTQMEKEPFGFVGTIDDLSLVLDEEVSA